MKQLMLMNRWSYLANTKNRHRTLTPVNQRNKWPQQPNDKGLAVDGDGS